jgi:hypothetical protein
VPRGDVAYTIEAGLRTFTERRMLAIAPDGTLALTEEGRRLAAFYAASVRHLFDATVEAAPEPRAARAAT